MSVAHVFHILSLMTLQTMSVLSVMKNLKAEADAGSIRPYCFVEVNGLKLASPENIYRVKINKLD